MEAARSATDAIPGSMPRIVIVLDTLDPERLASFWAGALGYQPSTAREPYVVLVPERPSGPELVLQRVAEPKTVKNRMHLDLRVPDLDAEVARLASLGATLDRKSVV